MVFVGPKMIQDDPMFHDLVSRSADVQEVCRLRSFSAVSRSDSLTEKERKTEDIGRCLFAASGWQYVDGSIELY